MSILICIPCFGGKLEAEFCQSLLLLVNCFKDNNIPHQIEFLANESLISRARNTFVNMFYSNTQFTHLLFLDADLVINPMSILALIKAEKELVGCSYAKKIYNWDKILSYIKDNPDVNKQDIQNKSLSLFTDSNYNFDKKNFEIDGSLVKSKDIPTGCMFIRRSVITALMMKYPERKYKSNIAGQKGDYFYDFFGVGVVDGFYLSEDYYFCHLCREIGIYPWLETRYTIGHVGREIFYNNLSEQMINFKNDNFNYDISQLKST
jgi:hypothetical protein